MCQQRGIKENILMMVFSLIFLFGSVIFYITSMGLFISSYRNLADYQFKHHHANWVEDGRPRGGKITRSEITFFTSDLASNFCILSWIFKMPTWLEKGSEGELYRSKMVRWFLVSLFAFFITGASFAFFVNVS